MLKSRMAVMKLIWTPLCRRAKLNHHLGVEGNEKIPIQFILLVWSCLLMRGEKQLFLTGDETGPTVMLKASFSKVNDITDLTSSPIQEAEG